MIKGSCLCGQVQYQIHHGLGPIIYCHCRRSQLYSERLTTPLTMRVRLGTLDDPITDRVSQHIFVGSKAEWHEITDDAIQYQERP